MGYHQFMVELLLACSLQSLTKLMQDLRVGKWVFDFGRETSSCPNGIADHSVLQHVIYFYAYGHLGGD